MKPPKWSMPGIDGAMVVPIHPWLESGGSGEGRVPGYDGGIARRLKSLGNPE